MLSIRIQPLFSIFIGLPIEITLKANPCILIVLFHFPACLLNAQNIDSLLGLFEKVSSSDQKARLAIEIGTYYLSRNLGEVNEYITIALDNCKPDDTLRISALDLKGKYYFFNNQLDSSLACFNQAQVVSVNSGHKKKEASLGISIGSVLLRMDRLEESVRSFIESAEYFEQNKDLVNAAKCYSNIASAQAKLNNFPEAIKYSKNALNIFQPLELHEFTLLTLPNLASHYVKIGDTVQALKFFREAEDLAVRLNDERSLSRIYNNLGDLFLTKSDFSSARQYFLKSLQLKKNLDQQKGLAQSYHNLAYTYAQDGEHEKALELYHAALNSATISEKIDIYKSIKKSYQAIDSLAKALYYSDLSQSIADSLQKITNLNTIAEINAKYESAKKENEILQLESERQQLQARESRNRYLLTGLLSLLAAIFLVAYLWIKNSRRKNIIDRQNHHLEKQKILEQLRHKELETIDLVIQGQQEERTRIASDLHDSLGSKMAALKLFLENIPSQDVGLHLQHARDLVNHSYLEVRNLSHYLGSGVLLDKGLVPALKNMASFINSVRELNMQVIEVDLTKRLNNTLEIQLLRIIQELVTNVIKHARAKNIIVQLTQYDDTLNLIIEDDGLGFSTAEMTVGMGFKNLEKRIEQINGSFHIDSEPGHGTTVMINIPT